MLGSRLASRLLLWLVLLAWLAGTAVLIWLMLVIPNQRAASPARDVAIELPEHPTLELLAARLAREKVIARPRAFTFYLRVLGVEPRLRSGWVVVNRALSINEHLPRLVRDYGQSRVEIVVPEGFTALDIAARVERFGIVPAAEFLRATRDRALLDQLGIEADSAEGYLFPAQYRFLQQSPPERVVGRMAVTFRARAEPLFVARAQAQDVGPGSALTPHQIVTLASIVEREARMPEERATIAGVFVNRLFDPNFKPKRLQADPTLAYGCLVAGERIPSCREFDGRHITPAMARDPENPYSTYRHEGLPPGPICNPGLSSLQAALAPERHAYFYFVAKGGGRHAFARTLEEHNHNLRTPALDVAP